MSDDPNAHLVGIGIVAVPDGFAASGALRVSLVLSPVLEGAGLGVPLDVPLDEWPETIAALIAAGRLTVSVAAPGNAAPAELRGLAVSGPPKDAREAAALWRRIVTGTDVPAGGSTGNASDMKAALVRNRNEREMLLTKLVDGAPPGGRAEVRVMASAPHPLARAVRAVHAAHSLMLMNRAAVNGPIRAADGAALLTGGIFRAKDPSVASSVAQGSKRQAEMRHELGYRFNLGERIRLNQAPLAPGEIDAAKAAATSRSDVLSQSFVKQLGRAYKVNADANASTVAGVLNGDGPFRPAASAPAEAKAAPGARFGRSAITVAQAAAAITGRPRLVAAAAGVETDADVVARHFAGYRASRTAASSDIVRPAPMAEGEVFARRLAGVMANPALAKFLGFIIDVEVPVEAVRAAAATGYGMVSAVLGSAPAGLRWSAFRLRTASAGKAAYFGPVSREEYADHPASPAAAEAYRHVDGLQNLGFVGDDSLPRFGLESVEADGLVHAVETASRSVADQQAEGEHPRHIDLALPHARTAGLSLMDTMRRDRVVEALIRRGEGSAAQPLFSDDLAIGYRIDIGWAPKGRPGAGAWRSLMERVVTFPGRHGPDEALTRFQASRPPGEREREAGVLRTPVRVNTFWADPIPGGGAGKDGPPGRAPIDAVADPQMQPAPDPVPAGHPDFAMSPAGAAPPAAVAPRDTPAAVFGGHDPGLPSGAVSHTPPDAPQADTPPLTTLGRPPLQVAEAIAHETMVTWRGWSLAVAACGEASQEIPDELDLPLDLGFDIPATAPPMWPLRFGRSYHVGVRLVWLNGSGVARAHADALYAAHPSLTLGAPETDPAHRAADGGFLFQRAEPIGAPDVVLRPEGRVAALPAGEQTTTLIVRSGLPGVDLGPDVGIAGRRAIVPPRVNEDFADLHGVFDHTPGHRPQGGLHDVDRPGKGGSFPWVDANGTLAHAADAQAGEGAQRSVLTYKPGAHASRAGSGAEGRDYWPDPLAEILHYAFMHGDQPAPGYPPPGQVPFYAAGRRWPDASAIHVQLRPAVAGELPPGVPARVGAYQPALHRVRSFGTAVSVTEGMLDIVLAPGEVVDLLIWSGPEDLRRLQQHSAPGLLTAALRDTDRPAVQAETHRTVEALGTATTEAAPADAAGPVLALLHQHPLPVLAANTRLTLIHAVPQPLPFGPVLGGQAFVRWLKRPDHPADGPDWTADLRDATRLYARGQVRFARASTAAVELRARWTEHEDLPSARSPLARSMTATLRADTPDADAGPSLDLERDDRGQARLLAFDLPDKRARRLTVTPVALSRFAKLYAPPASNLDKFERAGPAVAAVWANATAKPATPDLVPAGVTLVIGHEVTGPDNDLRFVVEHTTAARIHLRRGWFSSGEGEMLALIFPPKLPAGMDPLQQLEQSRQLEPYLTRWGADPTRLGPTLPGVLLPPSRVTGAATALLEYDLPLPDGATPVRVLGFDPMFDAAAGFWRVDIGIDGAGSPDLFVRMGLARLQVHAIKGLELSLPTSAWLAGLKPSRTVRVTVDAAARTVAVDILGSASRQSCTQAADKPLALGAVESATGLVAATDAPVMTVRLMRTRPAGSPIPVADPRTGIPIERHLAPDPTGIHPLAEQRTRWRTMLALPTPWQTGRYAVHVEEREWLAADDRATGGTVLAERGSPFHVLVRLDPGPSDAGVPQSGSSHSRFSQKE